MSYAWDVFAGLERATSGSDIATTDADASTSTTAAKVPVGSALATGVDGADPGSPTTDSLAEPSEGSATECEPVNDPTESAGGMKEAAVEREVYRQLALLCPWVHVKQSVWHRVVAADRCVLRVSLDIRCLWSLALHPSPPLSLAWPGAYTPIVMLCIFTVGQARRGIFFAPLCTRCLTHE